MTMATPTRQDLAKILATLPYGVLVQVATELVEMNKDPDFDRKVDTFHGMAETLYDWGEAQQHDVQ
jgi:hypothetical protein